MAALYDDWTKLEHKVRLQKFEAAAEKIYLEYPADEEAAIFYSLALRAGSDPADKSFSKQRKAGDLLNALFSDQPNHPGIAHYLIHTYDYPELAELALPAARKYAAGAATSAHALHMPSHIFTRLGLWDECVESNKNSISAAKCYAENSKMTGHWDEELHGIDYLVYAYLQQGRDSLAKEQLDYLRSIESVFPVNNKDAYTFASVPTRYALERKKWEEATSLQLKPASFPWENFPWERSLVSFGKVLGAVHLKKMVEAKSAWKELQYNHKMLMEKDKTYEANQVDIQIKVSEAWIRFADGHKTKAFELMTNAATMEDATEKHPITPGEVIPARELLGDMLMEASEFAKALEAYESNLKRHPGRFNGLYGAAVAAQQTGDMVKASRYFQQLMKTAQLSDKQRQEYADAESFLQRNL